LPRNPRYFQPPYGSRLAAWARQSSANPDRSVLEDEYRRLEGILDGDVPLPLFWGGYRVTLDSVEF
jgi:pyridoxamine 5'-phosphate oxidase